MKQALARSQYDASGILGRILYDAVVLFTFSTAFGVFGRNPISDYLRLPTVLVPVRRRALQADDRFQRVPTG